MSNTNANDYPSLPCELLLDESEASVSECTQRVEEALRTRGFFLLNSSTGGDVVDTALAAWAAFAALPAQAKAPFHQSVESGNARGGWLYLREAPVYMSHMDETERDTASPKQQFGCSIRTDNTLWPNDDTLEGFSRSIKACASGLDAVSRAVMRVFERVLQQPPGFFNYSPGYLTLSMYPGQASVTPEVRERSAGLQEHSDADVFTLLNQVVAALQIRDRSGRLLDVPALTGSQLLVLPGDWMELWSNGAIRAVRHRVLDVAQDRTSVAFFQNVEKMAIGPLDAFTDESNASSYPTVDSDIDYVGGSSGVARWRTQSDSNLHN